MTLTPTYSIVNTAGVSQLTVDLLIGLANEGFRLWSNVLAGDANVTVRITIDNIPSNRASGGWGHGLNLGSNNGYSVAIGAPAYELAYGTNANSTTPDIVINFDPDYLASELFLDPTPGTRDDIPINQTDGLSVMLHEIGHALGFTGYYNEQANSFSNNFNSLYDQRLVVENGEVFYDGPNTRAAYGNRIPLTNNNYAHYGNTNAYPGTSNDPLTGLMNGVVFYRGYAYTIGQLDLAVLADAGLGTIRDDILNAPLMEAMRGGAGNDTITGSAVNNRLYGDEGNDTLDGSGGADSLYGGDGTDVIHADAADILIEGGAGIDRVIFSSSGIYGGVITGIEAIEMRLGAAITFAGAQFNAGFAQNTAVSGTGTITVNMGVAGTIFAKLFSFTGSVSLVANGTTGSDIFKMGDTANTINTGNGNNIVQGGNLIDVIIGGIGIDKIAGNGGADILTGGAGADVFKYRKLTDSGLGAAADRITDFVIGNDRLNFSKIDANTGLAGDQAFAFVGSGVFSGGGAGSIRYQNSGADLLVQVDVDGNGTADMEIILEGLTGQTLSAGNFTLGSEFDEPGSASKDIPNVMDTLDSAKSVAPSVTFTEVAAAAYVPSQSVYYADSVADGIYGFICRHKDKEMMGPVEIV